MPQLFDFRLVTDRPAHGNIVNTDFLHEDMWTDVFNTGPILFLITLLKLNNSGLLSG